MLSILTSSLKNIPTEEEDERQKSTQPQTQASNISSQVKLEISSKPSLNYISETSKNYLKRGALNSDHLIPLLKQQANQQSSIDCLEDKLTISLSVKDQMLYDILHQQNVDLRSAENQNMAIYTLRKKFKNELEIDFLHNLVKTLPLFSGSNQSVSNESKDSQQFKRIVNELSHRMIQMHDVIFNHGEKGTEFFTVLKGSAFCLIPDPHYVKKDTGLKRIELISEKQNESKAETNVRSFLNTIAKSFNKKANIESNVRSFIGNLKSSFKKKTLQKQSPERRTSTKQIEEMLNLEDKIQKNLSDSEFVKNYYPGFVLVKTFLPGESFGEIALLTQQGRTATLVARENSDFMVLKKEGFDKVMGQMKKNTIREKIDFIKSFEFFSLLNTRRVLQIIQQTKIIKADLKKTIYEEGDNSNFIFLIKEGEVELKSRCPNPQELKKQFSVDVDEEKEETKDLEKLRMKKPKIDMKKLITVKILGKGGFFGEEEIVKGIKKRQDKAVCQSLEAEIYAIEKNRLQLVLGYNLFDRLKDQVQLKDSLRTTRLKNAIKMQIPQKDIQNLDTFLEKDRLKEEQTILKQELRQKIAVKLSNNFANRYATPISNIIPVSPSATMTTNVSASSNNTNGTIGSNNLSLQVTETDIIEYDRKQILQNNRNEFQQMSERINTIQLRLEQLTTTNAQNTTQTQPYSSRENKPMKSPRTIQIPRKPSIEEEFVLQDHYVPPRSSSWSKQELRRSLMKISSTLDNSLEENVLLPKSQRTIQAKSLTRFLEIEELNDEDVVDTPLQTKHNILDPKAFTSIAFLQTDSIEENQVQLQQYCQKPQLKQNSTVKLDSPEKQQQIEQQQYPKTDRLRSQSKESQKQSELDLCEYKQSGFTLKLRTRSQQRKIIRDQNAQPVNQLVLNSVNSIQSLTPRGVESNNSNIFGVSPPLSTISQSHRQINFQSSTNQVNQRPPSTSFTSSQEQLKNVKSEKDFGQFLIPSSELVQKKAQLVNSLSKQKSENTHVQRISNTSNGRNRKQQFIMNHNDRQQTLFSNSLQFNNSTLQQDNQKEVMNYKPTASMILETKKSIEPHRIRGVVKAEDKHQLIPNSFSYLSPFKQAQPKKEHSPPQVKPNFSFFTMNGNMLSKSTSNTFLQPLSLTPSLSQSSSNRILQNKGQLSQREMINSKQSSIRQDLELKSSRGNSNQEGTTSTLQLSKFASQTYITSPKELSMQQERHSTKSFFTTTTSTKNQSIKQGQLFRN